MSKKFINPPGLKALGMYSNVTSVSGGAIAFVSGQVSVNSEGKVVGAGAISRRRRCRCSRTSSSRSRVPGRHSMT